MYYETFGDSFWNFVITKAQSAMYGNGQVRTPEDAAYIRLAAAIIEKAGEDMYRNGKRIKRMKRKLDSVTDFDGRRKILLQLRNVQAEYNDSIEFFLSDYFELMSDMDGAEIVRRIENKIREETT